MELVAKYWKDEAGYSTFYNDNGFCHYLCNGDEFFVAHCSTKKGKSYKFYKEMQELAKEQGAKYLTGNLDRTEVNKEGYERKVMVHLGHGYKIIRVEEERITVLKHLY